MASLNLLNSSLSWIF